MSFDAARREFLKFGAVAALTTASGTAFATSTDDKLTPDLMRRAMNAVAIHRNRLEHIDRIGIVDFSRPSSAARFFIVEKETGTSHSYLVAHGRGSDPAHTGWTRLFSNEPGSYASSAGAYLTGAEYVGHHGRSMRLAGLDTENSNAQSRAIVIHAAWYVTPEIATRTGMLGRSEGCFAVSATSLDHVLDQLGPGRLLYAARA